MSFDTEEEAFNAYADAMPNNCVFLVDTTTLWKAFIMRFRSVGSCASKAMRWSESGWIRAISPT